MNKMNAKEVKDLFLKEKLVAICRTLPTEKLGNVARALVKGGVKILEITIDQRAEDPESVIMEAMQTVRDAVGDRLLLGCGTVLNLSQLEMAHKAGAAFYRSPNLNRDVVKRAKELGLCAIPGAMTPTEIVDAWDAGADIVKLFPADDMGYHYIWNLKGPLPHIPLLASGGVNPDTIPLFLEHGMVAVGTGISIINRDLLAADDYEGIAALARKHVDAIERCTK